MNNGLSIRHAITSNPALAALALEALETIDQTHFVGFYFEHFDHEGQDGEWNYWVAERADATTTNCYYTPGEIRALLVEKGYKAD